MKKLSILFALLMCAILECEALSVGRRFMVAGITYEILKDQRVKMVSACADWHGASKNYSVRAGVVYAGTYYVVAEIGDGAFANMRKLETVSMSSQVEAIGCDAFSLCSELREVKLNDGLMSVSYKAFANCKKLKAVELPSSLREIGSYAFQNCQALESVHLPQNVQSIGMCAFKGCTGLVFASLPDSLHGLGKLAFQGCRNLVSVSMSGDVPEMEEDVFEGCAALRGVKVSSAFPSACKAFPANLPADCCLFVPTDKAVATYRQTAGWQMFPHVVRTPLSCNGPWQKELFMAGGLVYSHHDGSLTVELMAGGDGHVVIPESLSFAGKSYPVKQISEQAFCGNSNLEALDIQAKIAEIPQYAFYKCSHLKSLRLSCTGIIGKRAFYGCSALKDLDLGCTLERLEEMSFAGCSALEEVELPRTLEYIGYAVFTGCRSLSAVKFLCWFVSAIEPNVGALRWDNSGVTLYVPEDALAYCLAKWHLAHSERLSTDAVAFWKFKEVLPLSAASATKGMALHAPQPEGIAEAPALSPLQSATPACDLQGRAAKASGTRGLLIQGGKKVLVK